MEASQVEEYNSLLIVIGVAFSMLAWIFNETVEAWLGLKPLQALRRTSPSVNENNARGVQPTEDPMRIPVTLYMTLVTTSSWKHFGTNPIYVLTSLLLRLYLVGEMWTRNMPWIFRYIFEFGIRTNYFEPFILLMGLLGFAERENIYDLSIMLLCPWGFVSLNPDTPIAALVTWSAATCYILVTRITTDLLYISVVQVTIVVLPVTLLHNHVLRMKAEQATFLAQATAESEAKHTQYVAHEVRNPLSVAVGGLSFVEEQVSALAVPGHIREMIIADVRMARRSMEFVDSLLTNMLDLAKTQAGKLELEVKRCSLLHDVLQPVVSMLSSNSITPKLSVETKEPLWVQADALRLKQVIVNLVKNAVKFVPSGFIRVGAMRDGPFVRLWVADSGPGIPADKHNKLFQKFTQLGSHDQGTGIGLCVCQNIAQQMGGKIEIDSNYHSGSTHGPGCKFVVVVRLQEAHPPTAKKVVPTQTIPSRLRGRRRVLIVDDDKLVRRILRRTFERVSDGWVLEEAIDAESCLALAAKNQYDIITIDHHMHVIGSDKDDMNGTDLIDALRQMGSRAYIIGCSGNDMSAKHFAAGANAFWNKPFPTGQRLVQELMDLPMPLHWRVLIADDQLMVRRLLARKLKKVLPNVTLTEAATSACAVKAIQSSAFDMIVLDQHIEDATGSVSLKGTELARLARSCGSKAIIAGYSANPMRAEHLAAGCDLSWNKAIGVQEIRKSLMRCMRGGDMVTSVQKAANEGARSKSNSSGTSSSSSKRKRSSERTSTESLHCAKKSQRPRWSS